ncbi:MAG: hypothetical protein RIE74_10500, partial [Pseudomonadales bacterium]
MDRTLTQFIRALRNAEVRVSTAETLDALSAVELVGYQDRAALKRSLALVLPKTADEKETFDLCFDQFFKAQTVAGGRAAANATDADAEEGDAEGGEGGGEGGEGAGGAEARTGKPKGKSISKSKRK